jgi:gliding motility-associated-like protein
VHVGTQGNISLTISQQVPVSCFGYSDAQLAVSSSDGAQPISFTWPDNSTNYIYSNASAGYYFVTATDNWGCTGSTGYSLTQPSQIMVSFITENVKCFGDNTGSVEANAIGGTQPYSYQWSNNIYSDSIYNLFAGQYPITVSDSHNCSTSAIANVTQPDQPLSLIYTVSNVSCFGEDDGTINTQATGGTSPYSWLWSYGIYNSTSSNLSGLFSGSYYVQINDINNCSFDTTFVISEPAPIDASYTYSNPSCLGNNDGQISVEVVGGTVPYLFVWNGGASPVPEISGLIQGTYIITITDNNMCSYVMSSVSLEDIDKDCIEIPNAFTPNADGVNDTWIIENIHMFPSAYIHVYNRWGQVVFESKGLDDPWDGTYNGRFVPAGVYIYIIDLYNRTDTYTGTVTIVY